MGGGVYVGMDSGRGEDVLYADAANAAPGADHLKAQIERISMPDDFHHNVCASAACGVFDLLHRIVIKMNHLRPQLRRLLQPFGDRINRINGIHHRQRARNRTHAHRPTSHNHSCVLFPVPGVEVLEEAGGGEVAGGEDVGHQDEHFFWDAGGGEDEGGVGEGAADVFGLSAIYIANQMSV